MYDGWDHIRGLGIRKERIRRLEIADRDIKRSRLQNEITIMVCFARRARRDYDWNVIPVFEGNELVVSNFSLKTLQYLMHPEKQSKIHI